MKLSQLNVRIEIQKSVSKQDEIGNSYDEWEPYFSCFAKIDSRGQSLGEVEAAGLTVDHSDLIFLIRYASLLRQLTTHQFRILFDNQIYNISRIDFMNYRHQWIKLYAKKVER